MYLSVLDFQDSRYRTAFIANGLELAAILKEQKRGLLRHPFVLFRHPVPGLEYRLDVRAGRGIHWFRHP